LPTGYWNWIEIIWKGFAKNGFLFWKMKLRTAADCRRKF